MLYLQGAREGMNKFVIMYMKGELLLQTLHNAERRSDEILRYFHTHTRVSVGSTLIRPLYQEHTTSDQNDVISAAYRLTPEMIPE